MIPWHFPLPISVPDNLRASTGGHPLVAEILTRRGFADSAAARAFLDPAQYTPSSPIDIPDMDRAVERLERSIREGEPVCVWGDFDVDGQTATALLVSTLEQLGAAVTYHVPIREVESHGVNVPVLEQLIRDGVKLFLTCDTGVSAQEAIEVANAHGVDVIVTDHHTPPESLPPALALVDPQLGPPEHPARTLPGVGVAYKLAEALTGRFGKSGFIESMLDLVALGIVADLAILTGDTRYLLQRGLEALRRTERPGLKVMVELAGLDPAGLTEEHIAFELGPRMNALGRLSDANLGVELLTTTDPARARVLATLLEGLNVQRRLLTSQVYQAAEAQIERDPALLDGAALVLTHSTWPAGVIGIVASRLVERYARPVALIAAPPGEPARGSARSIPGVDVTAAIAACRDSLDGFGGHPMAAGFALPAENIETFRRELSAAVMEQLAVSRIEPALQVDGTLPLSDLSPELVADLERLSPFGPGNPRPVLVAGGLRLKSQSTLGRSAEHRLMLVEDEREGSHKVIWWGGGGEVLSDWLADGSAFDLAYTARTSNYRGAQELQLEWVGARPAGGAAIEVPAEVPEIRVEDYRRAGQPAAVLKRLLEEGELQVWAEGPAREDLSELGVDAVDRDDLAPCARLAVWTTPPGREVMRAALEAVTPETVYLFAVDPRMDRLEPFLERLAGLVKYALRTNEGRAGLAALAAATAQRKPVVRLGLAWLVARGHLWVMSVEGDDIVLGEGGQENPDELSHIDEQLKEMLAEISAFRAYYSRAEADGLVGVGMIDGRLNR